MECQLEGFLRPPTSDLRPPTPKNCHLSRNTCSDTFSFMPGCRKWQYLICRLFLPSIQPDCAVKIPPTGHPLSSGNLRLQHFPTPQSPILPIKPKTTLLRSFLALAGSSLLALSSAHAAIRTWDGDTSTSWGASGNWDTGVPGTADTANFNLPGPYGSSEADLLATAHS